MRVEFINCCCNIHSTKGPKVKGDVLILLQSEEEALRIGKTCSRVLDVRVDQLAHVDDLQLSNNICILPVRIKNKSSFG
jgi:hypothetical protein